MMGILGYTDICLSIFWCNSDVSSVHYILLMYPLSSWLSVSYPPPDSGPIFLLMILLVLWDDWLSPPALQAGKGDRKLAILQRGKASSSIAIHNRVSVWDVAPNENVLIQMTFASVNAIVSTIIGLVRCWSRDKIQIYFFLLHNFDIFISTVIVLPIHVQPKTTPRFILL